MAINFDEIWTNVKKNALGAKDLASLKLQLTKEKAHLDELYRALGENVYAVRTKQAVDESAAISEQISASLIDIEQMEESVSRISGSVRCPGCERTVASTYSFCPHCGTALPHEEKTESDQEFDSAFDEMMGNGARSSENDSDDNDGSHNGGEK